MDIIKQREEFLKKKMLNDINNTTNINNKYISDSQKLDEIIKLVSNKINNTILIEESLIDDIYIKLKFLCANHNDKIKNWFDEKYESDLKQIIDTNLIFNNIANIYEKNCYISCDIILS